MIEHSNCLSPQMFLNALNQETDFAQIERVLTVAASFMKHEGFQPEQEFRVIVLPELQDVKFRESSDRLVPFVDFLQNKTPLPIDRYYHRARVATVKIAV